MTPERAIPAQASLRPVFAHRRLHHKDELSASAARQAPQDAITQALGENSGVYFLPVITDIDSRTRLTILCTVVRWSFHAKAIWRIEYPSR